MLLFYFYQLYVRVKRLQRKCMYLSKEEFIQNKK